MKLDEHNNSNEVLYNGLHDESSPLCLQDFTNGFATACFPESRKTAVENELFSISVNIVVIGSETISELILRLFNGSFLKLVLFTVRNKQIIYSWLISAKFMRDKTGKSGISWLFDGGKLLNIQLNSFAN